MKTELLKEGISQLGLSCSDHQIELLQRYSELLLKWNKVYNLTSIRNPDEVLTHHIFDSLSIIPVYRSLHPDPITIMDVCTFAPAHMHELLTSLEGKSPGLGAPAVQDGWMEAQQL